MEHEQPVQKKHVRVACLGAGWWSQGWHLPHLSRHPDVIIAAIVEPSRNIRSTLNPEIEQVDELSKRYAVETFDTLHAALAAGIELDAVVVGASHSAHAHLGTEALMAGLHVFMEKVDPPKPLMLIGSLQVKFGFLSSSSTLPDSLCVAHSP